MAQDKESTYNEAYAGMIPVSMRLQRVQHDLVTKPTATLHFTIKGFVCVCVCVCVCFVLIRKP